MNPTHQHTSQLSFASAALPSSSSPSVLNHRRRGSWQPNPDRDATTPGCHNRVIGNSSRGSKASTANRVKDFSLNESIHKPKIKWHRKTFVRNVCDEVTEGRSDVISSAAAEKDGSILAEGGDDDDMKTRRSCASGRQLEFQTSNRITKRKLSPERRILEDFGFQKQPQTIGHKTCPCCKPRGQNKNSHTSNTIYSKCENRAIPAVTAEPRKVRLHSIVNPERSKISETIVPRQFGGQCGPDDNEAVPASSDVKDTRLRHNNEALSQSSASGRSGNGEKENTRSGSRRERFSFSHASNFDENPLATNQARSRAFRTCTHATFTPAKCIKCKPCKNGDGHEGYKDQKELISNRTAGHGDREQSNLECASMCQHNKARHSCEAKAKANYASLHGASTQRSDCRLNRLIEYQDQYVNNKKMSEKSIAADDTYRTSTFPSAIGFRNSSIQPRRRFVKQVMTESHSNSTKDSPFLNDSPGSTQPLISAPTTRTASAVTSRPDEDADDLDFIQSYQAHSSATCLSRDGTFTVSCLSSTNPSAGDDLDLASSSCLTTSFSNAQHWFPRFQKQKSDLLEGNETTHVVHSSERLKRTKRVGTELEKMRADNKSDFGTSTRGKRKSLNGSSLTSTYTTDVIKGCGHVKFDEDVGDFPNDATRDPSDAQMMGEGAGDVCDARCARPDHATGDLDASRFKDDMEFLKGFQMSLFEMIEMLGREHTSALRRFRSKAVRMSDASCDDQEEHDGDERGVGSEYVNFDYDEDGGDEDDDFDDDDESDENGGEIDVDYVDSDNDKDDDEYFSSGTAIADDEVMYDTDKEEGDENYDDINDDDANGEDTLFSERRNSVKTSQHAGSFCDIEMRDSRCMGDFKTQFCTSENCSRQDEKNSRPSEISRSGGVGDDRTNAVGVRTGTKMHVANLSNNARSKFLSNRSEHSTRTRHDTVDSSTRSSGTTRGTGRLQKRDFESPKEINDKGNIMAVAHKSSLKYESHTGRQHHMQQDRKGNSNSYSTNCNTNKPLFPFTSSRVNAAKKAKAPSAFNSIKKRDNVDGYEKGKREGLERRNGNGDGNDGDGAYIDVALGCPELPAGSRRHKKSSDVPNSLGERHIAIYLFLAASFVIQVFVQAL